MVDGLLGPQFKRECRYGHGVLELLMGSFALAGVMPLPPRSAYETIFSQASRRPDGRLLALKVWKCPTCGYVELVDDASA